MKHRGLALALVATAIVLLTGLFAFGLSRDPSQLRSTLVGRTAPDFTLKTLDGKGSVRLSQLKGQVVVINFWASWCAECRIEEPALAAAWARYRDQRVVVLGISFQDGRDAALAYAGGHRMSWPLLDDPESRTGLAFGVSGVPETIFIGPDGRVDAKQVGPVTDELLTARVTTLLAQMAPA